MTFPKMKNKHDEDPLISAKDFLEYRRKIGKHPKLKPLKGIIFCYSRTFFNQIIKKHKGRKVEGFLGDLYLLKETKEQVGMLGKFGIGSPAVVTSMEELIFCGVKNFLSIGDAGGLKKNLKVGSIVVCDKAIRDEGTSYHYLKPSKYAYASKTMLKKIKKTLEKFGLKYTVGTSWTIDAPYRETIAEVKKYKKEGVLTVEMEASAVFALAKYRNVEAGAIFTVSDYLSELDWKPKFHLSKKYLEKVFLVCKDILMSY